MTARPRHLLNGKTWFYGAALPALGWLGPDRRDAVLRAIGRSSAVWPDRARRIDAALRIARHALGASWNPDEVRRELASNLVRFAARDYVLEGLDDNEALGRFEVSGGEHLDQILRAGRGVILLGCHLGAYLSGLHWLVRRNVPMRLMVQRPNHVSAELQGWFNRRETNDRHAQTGFFLRRAMPPGEGALRVLRARSALRDGLAVYINGDVAWDSGCARPGRLLGRHRGYLSAWADLAVVTAAPVVPIFCLHRPGGRFALTIDPPWHLAPGGQQEAVDRYLARLEAAITAQPAEAVAHLLWPSFGVAPSRAPALARPAALRPQPIGDLRPARSSMF